MDNLHDGQKKSVNRIVLLIGILSFSFYSTAHMQIATPVIEILARDIGESNTTLLGLISTLPSLAFIPANLVFGRLSLRYNKKTLYLIGTLLWVTGGFLTVFCSSIGPILACRVLIGFGTGFCIPLVTAIVPDYYEGEKAGTMIGVNTGIAGVWGFAIANASGALAAYGWRASFSLHLLGVVILLIGMLCIPKKPLVEAPPPPENVGSADGAKRRPLDRIVYAYAALIGLLMLPITAFWSFASMFIAQEGLGSTAQAGLAISLITLFSSITALLASRIMAAIKRMTLFCGCLMLALSFVFIVYAQNYAMVIIGVALLGGCQGLLVPFMLIRAATLSSLDTQALAQSVILIGIYVGQFLASPWFAAISAVFHAETVRGVLSANLWFCAIVALAVLGVALLKRPAKPGA
jgi:MFS family permease